MNLQPKAALARKFWLCMTAYVLTSFSAFVLSTSGYTAILYFLYLGPFYLGIWIVLTLVCIASRSVLYSAILLYFILVIQTLAIILNVGDAGYYGLACGRNFVPRFFHQNTSCSGLWVSWQTYQWILLLYVVLVVIFLINILWLQSLSSGHRRPPNH